MTIESPIHRYWIGDQAADAGSYRLYLCKQEETSRQCLLQIADHPARNGSLDRAAYFLRELAAQADELESEYAKVKADSTAMLNYGLGFPELLDSFISGEQGGRRINILAFRNVEDVGSIVPLSKIINKSRLRVDLRTSVWILGKTLKLLAFAHSLGFSVGRLDSTNILIEPDRHYVIFFDWSNAIAHPIGGVPADFSATDIMAATGSVIQLLGLDDLLSVEIPGGERAPQYVKYLRSLVLGSQHDAKAAHARFYELVDAIWERKYYPFTSLPR